MRSRTKLVLFVGLVALAVCLFLSDVLNRGRANAERGDAGTRGRGDAATADQCRDKPAPSTSSGQALSLTKGQGAVGEHADASAAGAASYNAGSAEPALSEAKGAAPSPTELSAEEREKAAEALEKIPQPIEMVAGDADGTAGPAKFVIRDRNVSA